MWKNCNACKKSIPYGAKYWVCNVSTCNRKRTGLIFCDVSCWDAHLPDMNHREAWAVEKRAPKTAQEARELENSPALRERSAGEKPAATAAPQATPRSSSAPKTILRRRPPE